MKSTDILRTLIELKESAERPPEIPMSEEEQKQYLNGFVMPRIEALKIGDFVERNEYGMDEYKLPKEGELAMVIDIFSPQLDADKSVYNGQIMVVTKHSHDDKGEHLHQSTFPVDLRFYKKVEV